jgi:hypothetical protein
LAFTAEAKPLVARFQDFKIDAIHDCNFDMKKGLDRLAGVKPILCHVMQS